MIVQVVILFSYFKLLNMIDLLLLRFENDRKANQSNNFVSNIIFEICIHNNRPFKSKQRLQVFFKISCILLFSARSFFLVLSFLAHVHFSLYCPFLRSFKNHYLKAFFLRSDFLSCNIILKRSFNSQKYLCLSELQL